MVFSLTPVSMKFKYNLSQIKRCNQKVGEVTVYQDFMIHCAMRELTLDELDYISGGDAQAGQATAGGAVAGGIFGAGATGVGIVNGALDGAGFGAVGGPFAAGIGLVAGAVIGGAIGFVAYETGNALDSAMRNGSGQNNVTPMGDANL